MFLVPISLERDDNGTFLVTSPALPEVTTFGDTPEDAHAHAFDAIEEAIGARMSRWADIDLGEEIGRGHRVGLSLLTELKLRLFLACKEAGISRADLARMMEVHREQVDRLFRLDHASRADQIEHAFRVIGKKLAIQVEEAA